jgi:hypothetical protein
MCAPAAVCQLRGSQLESLQVDSFFDEFLSKLHVLAIWCAAAVPSPSLPPHAFEPPPQPCSPLPSTMRHQPPPRVGAAAPARNPDGLQYLSEQHTRCGEGPN